LSIGEEENMEFYSPILVAKISMPDGSIKLFEYVGPSSNPGYSIVEDKGTGRTIEVLASEVGLVEYNSKLWDTFRK
jgi:hypothetical protein